MTVVEDDRIAYLDTSAFVKLVVEETESSAFQSAVVSWSRWASSALLEVEAVIAARRRGPVALNLARRLLRAVEVIEMDPDIRHAAGELAGLRSLDAIHLATALSLGERCGAFFAYDDRLATAARSHGLSVSVPRP